jgi:hypothetical protein
MTHVAAQLRNFLQRNVSYYRSHDNATEVYHAIQSAASAFEGTEPSVAEAARAIPFVQLVPPSPLATQRTPKFDAFVEAFIVEFDAAIGRVEFYEERSFKNQTLTRMQCRDGVLAFLATTMDWISNQEVARAVGLSEEQIYLGFEKLQHDQMIEARRAGPQWMVKINAHGRDCAEGIEPPAPVVIHAPTYDNRQFHASTIGVLGNVSGDATQNVTVSADVGDLINALQRVRDADRTAFGVVLLAQQAEVELLAQGFSDRAKVLIENIGPLAARNPMVNAAYEFLCSVIANRGCG